MLWIILIIVGILAGLIGLMMVVVGMLLPQNHSASLTARFAQPPEVIWATITDHANEPSWRRDLRSKQRLDDRNGHAVWRETRKRGDTMTFETIAFEPPRKMVGRIADDNLPFGGTWTYEVKPAGDAAGGSTLTITEDGEIYNPAFRFIARFIIGYRGTITSYLAALSRKFGQEAAFID